MTNVPIAPSYQFTCHYSTLTIQAFDYSCDRFAFQKHIAVKSQEILQLQAISSLASSFTSEITSCWNSLFTESSC